MTNTPNTTDTTATINEEERQRANMLAAQANQHSETQNNPASPSNATQTSPEATTGAKQQQDESSSTTSDTAQTQSEQQAHIMPSNSFRPIQRQHTSSSSLSSLDDASDVGYESDISYESNATESPTMHSGASSPDTSLSVDRDTTAPGHRVDHNQVTTQDQVTVQPNDIKLSGELIRDYDRKNHQKAIWNQLQVYNKIVYNGNPELTEKSANERKAIVDNLFTSKTKMFRKAHNIHYIFSKKKPNIPAVFDILLHIKYGSPELLEKAWQCLDSHCDNPAVITTLMQYCKQKGEVDLMDSAWKHLNKHWNNPHTMQTIMNYYQSQDDTVRYYELQREALLRFSNDFETLQQYIPELSNPKYIISVIERLLYVNDPQDTAKVMMNYDRFSNEKEMREIIEIFHNLFSMSIASIDNDIHQEIQFLMAEYLANVYQNANSSDEIIRRNSEMTLTIMLAAGIHPNIVTKNDSSPIISAVKQGKYELWKKLNTLQIPESFSSFLPTELNQFQQSDNGMTQILAVKSHHESAVFCSLSMQILMRRAIEKIPTTQTTSDEEIEEIIQEIMSDLEIFLNPNDIRHIVKAIQTSSKEQLMSDFMKITNDALDQLTIDDLRVTNGNETNILHLLFQCENEDMIKRSILKILEIIGNDSSYLNSQDNFNKTPLDYFLENNYVISSDTLKVLLENNSHFTNQTDITRLLAYFDDDEMKKIICHATHSPFKTNLVQYLLLKGKFNLVEGILEKYPQAIHITNPNMNYTTLLHDAIERVFSFCDDTNTIEAIKIIREHNPEIDIDQLDEEGDFSIEDSFKAFDLIMSHNPNIEAMHLKLGNTLSSAIYYYNRLKNSHNSDAMEVFRDKIIIPLIKAGASVLSNYATESTISNGSAIIKNMPELFVDLIEYIPLSDLTKQISTQNDTSKEQHSTLLQEIIKSLCIDDSSTALQDIISKLPMESLLAADSFGETILYTAVDVGYSNIAKILLQSGSLLHHTPPSNDLSSPLFQACLYNRSIAREFQNYLSLKITQPTLDDYFTRKNSSGETIFIHLIQHAIDNKATLDMTVDLIEKVLEARELSSEHQQFYRKVLNTQDSEGLDCFIQICDHLATAQHASAVEKQSLQRILQSLIIAQPNYSHQTKNGNLTGLHLLARSGLADNIQNILSSITDTSALTKKDDNKKTFLDYLITNPNVSATQLAEICAVHPKQLKPILAAAQDPDKYDADIVEKSQNALEHLNERLRERKVTELSTTEKLTRGLRKLSGSSPSSSPLSSRPASPASSRSVSRSSSESSDDGTDVSAANTDDSQVAVKTASPANKAAEKMQQISQAAAKGFNKLKFAFTPNKQKPQ